MIYSSRKYLGAKTVKIDDGRSSMCNENLQQLAALTLLGEIYEGAIRACGDDFQGIETYVKSRIEKMTCCEKAALEEAFRQVLQASEPLLSGLH